MLTQHEINLAYRVLDANYNRAVEGLRVVEEYFRFVLESSFHTGQIKELRHELCSTCSNWISIWTDQRDSSADVGATITTSDEYKRSQFNDIVDANLARVNQALRALEEYAKAVCPELPAKLEATRYKFYDLEKSVKRAFYAHTKMGDKSIYVLTGGCRTDEEFKKRVLALCDAGADLIQLRDKDLDDVELLERARTGVRACFDFQTRFIVNDRPDIALLAEADGVHVGQEEIPVQEIRKMLPFGMLIGVSTHSLEQARKAELEGADYIGVGPTFPSHTKCFSEFTGTELLKQVAESISVPAFAIGGINLDNIAEVAKSGFTRVAVSSVVNRSDSPKETIDQLRHALANISNTDLESLDAASEADRAK